MLPEDVLLEIFDICRKNYDPLYIWAVWRWHLLVHICRRWRQVVFTSPLRLDLRIFCTKGAPVRKNLCIWPRLPIVLSYYYGLRGHCLAPGDEDNVIAALEHPDRVSSLDLEVTGSQLRSIATVMQEPFPLLRRLWLNIPPLHQNAPIKAPVLPAEFLGGSAPRLQEIILHGIPFPALPTLLLSASDLTYLHLYDVPPTGYISPEAMVVGLAALPRLEHFIIEFSFTSPRPYRIHPPPSTRTVLPALTSFEFKGASEYLEDLVGQIDSPQLVYIEVTYLNQLVDFQAAQLSEFIDRSVGPELTSLGRAHFDFRNDFVSFNVTHQNYPAVGGVPFKLCISCKGIDWQVSHMAQVLSQFPATLSTIQHLALTAKFGDPPVEGMDNAEWSHLLQQFSAVKTLKVSQELADNVSLTLENIPGGVFAEALPCLDLINLAGQPASSIKNFVAFRQLSGSPVTVIDREAEFYERLKSYITA